MSDFRSHRRPRKIAVPVVISTVLLCAACLQIVGTPTLARVPPPVPLPCEPDDTDGQPYELPDRPNPGGVSPQLDPPGAHRKPADSRINNPVARTTNNKLVGWECARIALFRMVETVFFSR